MDTYANRDFKGRMGCDMPNISFCLNDASSFLIFLGTSHYDETTLNKRDKTISDQALAQISTLLKNHISSQWLESSRGRILQNRRVFGR